MRFVLRMAPLGAAGSTLAGMAIMPMATVIFGSLLSLAASFGFLAWRTFR